jgi:hypothetical protein
VGGSCLFPSYPSRVTALHTPQVVLREPQACMTGVRVVVSYCVKVGNDVLYSVDEAVMHLGTHGTDVVCCLCLSVFLLFAIALDSLAGLQQRLISMRQLEDVPFTYVFANAESLMSKERVFVEAIENASSITVTGKVLDIQEPSRLSYWYELCLLVFAH